MPSRSLCALKVCADQNCLRDLGSRTIFWDIFFRTTDFGTFLGQTDQIFVISVQNYIKRKKKNFGTFFKKNPFPGGKIPQIDLGPSEMVFLSENTFFKKKKFFFFEILASLSLILCLITSQPFIRF